MIERQTEFLSRLNISCSGQHHQYQPVGSPPAQPSVHSLNRRHSSRAGTWTWTAWQTGGSGRTPCQVVTSSRLSWRCLLIPLLGQDLQLDLTTKHCNALVTGYGGDSVTLDCPGSQILLTPRLPQHLPRLHEALYKNHTESSIYIVVNSPSTSDKYFNPTPEISSFIKQTGRQISTLRWRV